MKAAKLVDIGKIEVSQIKEPIITNKTDVKVKVKAVGICGTDLHIFKSGRDDVAFPRIMGHELSGLVTEIGKEVTNLKVGDRVALDPVFACGECPTCKKGYQNVCNNVKCYGVQMDGGYQEYIVVDQKHLYPFAESISFAQAALAEPFSIASNILERTYATDKDKILIIGCGTIGLAIAQSAKALGAKVMVADIVDTKLKKAQKLGVDKVVNSKKVDLPTEVESFSQGGFDVVIDAVGVTKLFQQSLTFAAPRARVACIGFDSKPAQIQPVMITKKELSIIGSRMNCYQFPKVMKMLNDGKINADLMISRKYSIDDIQKAFVETLQSSENIVKTLIQF